MRTAFGPEHGCFGPATAYRKLVEADAKVKIESVDRYSESELAHAPQFFVAGQPAAGCLGVGAGVLLLGLVMVLSS
jgi:hypothetical protein